MLNLTGHAQLQSVQNEQQAVQDNTAGAGERSRAACDAETCIRLSMRAMQLGGECVWRCGEATIR
jgi:hypothetical protein